MKEDGISFLGFECAVEAIGDEIEAREVEKWNGEQIDRYPSSHFLRGRNHVQVRINPLII